MRMDFHELETKEEQKKEEQKKVDEKRNEKFIILRFFLYFHSFENTIYFKK